jgi:murein L,D-transpeptidase YafK
MLYQVKRFVLYQSKSIENFLRTWRKQRAILKAYYPESSARWMFPYRMLIAFVIACATTGGLVFVIVNNHDTLWNGTVKLLSGIRNIEQRIAEKVRVVNTKLVPATSEKRETQPSQVVRKVAPVIPLTPAPIVPGDTTAYLRTNVVYPDDLNYMLLANKMEKKMFLLQRHKNAWSLYRSYNIAIGVQDGPKFRAGDKKTPEGIYFIAGRKFSMELSTVYGPLAYVLNYPNRHDIAEGHTGQGIWIHGTNPDSTPLNTRGCLEMNNVDLVELSGILKAGIGTPVYIVNTPPIADPVGFCDYPMILDERRIVLTEYEKQKTLFTQVLTNWKQAWESRDIERYSLFYKTDVFSSQGMDWEQWREKKASTFQSYSTIVISIDAITLVDFSESLAVVTFKQEYSSDQIQIVNGKKLNLVNVNGEWKISKETTFPKEELLL